MSEGKLYRWSKSIDDDQLDWWETELIAVGVAYAIEKTANRKRTRVSAYETERSAAEQLKARFGGGVSALRPKDWQHQAADERAPLKIRDRFVVTRQSDPREIEKLAAVFPSREILSFPPRLAFGTGGHPTTASCLRLLVDAARKRSGDTSWPMLDLGCGSGILAVAAAKLGANPVDAIEFDPLAIGVARENAARHETDGIIHFIEADAVAWVKDVGSGTGSKHPAGPYPIIAANLFTDLLVTILPHLPNHLAPGGTVIFSGFLTSQTNSVNEAAKQSGIRLDRFIRRGKWVAAAGSHA